MRKFSDEVVEKALRLREDGTITPLAGPGGHTVAWRVQHEYRAPKITTYRVQTDYDPAKGTVSWITCTCEHGKNLGDSRCYHAAAVLLHIRDEETA